VEFEVPTGVNVMIVFRDVIPYSVADKYLCYGGTCCSHVQGRKWLQRTRCQIPDDSILRGKVADIANFNLGIYQGEMRKITKNCRTSVRVDIMSKPKE
jgi:hypothetical protein